MKKHVHKGIKLIKILKYTYLATCSRSPCMGALGAVVVLGAGTLPEPVESVPLDTERVTMGDLR